jgi:hypothetical protein
MEVEGVPTQALPLPPTTAAHDLVLEATRRFCSDGSTSRTLRTRSRNRPVPEPTVPPANDGPFGLTLGMDFVTFRKQFAVDSNVAVRGVYTVRRVPRPMPEFESVQVVAAPKAGVCKITGIGVTLESNAFGDQVRSAFSDLRTLVVEKYGTPKDFDFLQAGSIWKDRQDWMMALRKKERTLTAIWTTKDGATLPTTTDAIMLSSNALSANQAFLRLSFDGTALDACIKELRPNALGG